MPFLVMIAVFTIFCHTIYEPSDPIGCDTNYFDAIIVSEFYYYLKRNLNETHSKEWRTEYDFSVGYVNKIQIAIANHS